MKQLTLCLAFHNHQPVGNFSWVFADSYRHAYLPLLDALERHPSVRVSLHYTGPLIDWIRQNDPSFLLRVRALVDRGQVEIMTGGYYEPILPAIPEIDRLGQIRKMTRFVEDEFGTTPTGLWLAERVWEPQLPSELKRAGVDWTIVDDTHFKMSGLDDADLDGYYLTEDEGAALKVFATSKRLRYIIPWATVDDVIAELREAASEDPSLMWAMGDDGEKFGVWPSTYEHCWVKGWMERFFSALEENATWLKLLPLGEYAVQHAARGRIYLPTASYAEMMEWALPARAAAEFGAIYHEMDAQKREDVTRFLRGGFWRNFLAKYDEVNAMHKKMLRVHRKVQATAVTGGEPDSIALDELWQGQCNCPYWHGVFGGVYMTDVRTATFHHLIRAETRADQISHDGNLWIQHDTLDYDCDSRDEIIVDSPRASYVFHPTMGGALGEWDARRAGHNLTSVLTRRPEAYHQALRQAAKAAEQADSGAVKTIHEIVKLKEPGLERRLHYDWYRKLSLIDHFLLPDATPESFASNTYGEAGDFVQQPYQVTVDGDETTREVRLSRQGQIRNGSELLAVIVQKVVRLSSADAGFTADYEVVNRSAAPLETRFGVELNVNFLGGGGNPQAYARFVGKTTEEGQFGGARSIDAVTRVSVGNHQLGLEASLDTSQPAMAWWSSIDSVSSSEGGFERVHQGGSLLLGWPLRLAVGQTWQVTLRVGVTE